MKKLSSIFILLVVAMGYTFCQSSEPKLIQFSGFAMTADSLIGVPYTHITIKNAKRAATAGPDGFFSFAAHTGDTLYFTSVGFKPTVYLIPKNLEADKYSVIQMMNKTEYYLPTTIIYPWGGRDGFKKAFREVKLNKTQDEIAAENTNRQLLAALGESLPTDGNESTERYMRAEAAKAYYYGQTAPQNIFNPLAWAEFIRAWKRGDFKKKEKYVQPAHEY